MTLLILLKKRINFFRQNVYIEKMNKNRLQFINLFTLIVALYCLQLTKSQGNCVNIATPCPNGTGTSLAGSSATYARCYPDSGIYCGGAITSSILSPCIDGCYFCSGPVDCDTCEGGWYYSTQSCLRCIANCAQCTGPTDCASCNPGFLYGGGGCTACSSIYAGCSSCNLFMCTGCASPLFLNASAASSSSACVPCPRNCQGCTAGPTCSGCPAAFTLSSNSCSINTPIQFCRFYNDDGTCFQCQINFSLIGAICGYTLDIPNCQTVEATGLCGSCYAPFTLQPNKTVCSPKTPIHNCMIYADADGTCSTCFAAFIPDGSLCVIALPIEHCQFYYDNGTCNACFPSFAKDSPITCSIITPIFNCQFYQDNGNCKSCFAPFTLNSDALGCTIKNPTTNCQFYQNDGTCKDCFISFSIQMDLSCLIIDPIRNCQLYLDNGACKSCFSPFSVSSENLTCIPKNPLQYCQLYEDDGTCFKCYDSFTKSADNLVCTITVPRQFCQTYENDGTCMACIHTKLDNYAVEADKLSCYNCYSVSKLCFECTSIHTCKECNMPFRADHYGACELCAVQYQNVSGNCVSSNGCLNQQIIGNKNVCLGCASQLYFQYNKISKKCVCQAGYKQNLEEGILKCISVCGNGILAHDEECDDNNVMDNDGCSKFCKKQSGFQCDSDSSDSSSYCTLNLKIDKFEQNYAEKVDGQNKCKFSFSVSPLHIAFQKVQWSNYLSTNLTKEYIIQSSLAYEYKKETNQIIYEFEYIKDIQNVIVKATLTLDNDPAVSNVRLLNQVKNELNENSSKEMLSESKRSLSLSSSNLFGLVSNPSSLSLMLTISGINQRLNFQSNASQMNQANKVASILYIAVSVLIILQFIIGSYWHKMIGLETIQIFQFVYVVRMTLEQSLQGYFKSMNVLEYTAFGGYNNWSLFYNLSEGIMKLITRSGENVGFNSIGILKYFTFNINICLLPLVLFALYYAGHIFLKYCKRNNYLQKRSQEDLDLYTIARRKCQWIYNHLIFPFVMLFNIVSFFITILRFNSLTGENSQIAIKFDQIVRSIQFFNVPVHLIMLYSTIGIYCFELFISNQQYWYSKLTQQEKQRAPKSMIQKLQHDQNNPTDQENYKPGYVLAYLAYYFTLQLLIAISLFSQHSTRLLILYVMASIAVLYVVLLFLWNPYYQCSSIHNYVIKYNHLVLALFVILLMIAATMTKIQSTVSIILINYLMVVLMVVICVLGYVRVYVQYQFRKKLEVDSSLLFNQIKKVNQLEEQQARKEETNVFKEKLTKRQLLLNNNPFIFHRVDQIEAQQSAKWNKKLRLTEDNYQPQKFKHISHKKKWRQIKRDLIKVQKQQKQR